MSIHFIQADLEEGLTPENILAMVVNEIGGYALEHGYQKTQYIIKRKAYIPDTNIKTRCCAARIHGDKITVIGTSNHTLLISDPNFFDNLKAIIDYPQFMLPSSKDFDEPLCNKRKDH